MQFSGIPVLFIPGQGGSLKQVRSLASVSLRKSLGSELQYHFDYFTLDLNEEYSAMFGGVLTDQTRFAVYAVQRILSLYRRVRPDSIVLIGHSMGGMIAKGMFLEPDFPVYAIRLVITLATPHSPVLLTDPLIRDYYQHVTPHWSSRTDNVTVISLGGGVKDLVVRSGLTLTDQADISALTTAVSEVWLSVDHLCILWCKQLVLVLVRALFDCVDLHTLQISRDPYHRLTVFKYHLLERSAGKRYYEAVHPPSVTLQTQRAEWMELSRPHWSHTRPSQPSPAHVIVHLPSTPTVGGEDTLAVVVRGHKGRDWLFGCTTVSYMDTGSGSRHVCSVGENLSSLGRIAPSKHRKHKVALVSLRDLRNRGLNYVVIRLPPSEEPTSVSYDMFSARERTVVASLPRWYIPWFQGTTLIPSTAPDTLFYTLDLPQLERPWQAYQLRLTTLSCANSSHQAVATLRVPWSHQHYSVVLRNSAETVAPIMLHTTRPSDWKGPDPYITLYLDPKCQYSVQLESSLVDSLAQVVRLYSSQLVAYVAAILLLTLRQQLLSLGSQQHCLLFHHALLEGAKPYYILPAVKIASTLLSRVPEPLSMLLPLGDLTSLQQSGLDFLLLPFIMYAIAFSFVFLLGLLVYVGVVCSGSTINKFALKFVGKLAGVSRTWTDWLMAAIDKVPCVVSLAMVGILMSSCGGLAMVVGAIYYFMRVCGMYEDYIEQLFFAPVKYLKDTVIAKWKGQPTRIVDEMIREAEDLLSLKGLTEFNFHMTLVLLWGTSTFVHLPSVLVWAHNFKYNPVLDPDPATTVALASSLCVAVIWTLDTPVCSEQSSEMYKKMSGVMFVLAILTLIYCPISLYNLPVLISSSFMCLALHQLYEWTGKRFFHSSEPSTVSVSDTTLATDSEEDQSKPAIKDSPDSDDETPTESDGSRKNSRTSELSMSSYDAVSLTELKGAEKTVEKAEDEDSIEEEDEEEEEEEEEEDDENDVENNEEEEEEGYELDQVHQQESEREKHLEQKEQSESTEQKELTDDENDRTKGVTPEHSVKKQIDKKEQSKVKQIEPKEQISNGESNKKDSALLKRKQKKDSD